MYWLMFGIPAFGKMSPAKTSCRSVALSSAPAHWALPLIGFSDRTAPWKLALANIIKSFIAKWGKRRLKINLVRGILYIGGATSFIIILDKIKSFEWDLAHTHLYFCSHMINSISRIFCYSFLIYFSSFTRQYLTIHSSTMNYKSWFSFKLIS